MVQAQAQSQAQAQTREQELIDQLIATYRELNARVRPLPEERLQLRMGGQPSVRDLITRLRDSELRFSQALKERITGVPMPEIFGEEAAPIVGTERPDDRTAKILSEFGTARESTLAMLRGLPPAAWHGTVASGATIADRIAQLVANDRRHLELINGLLGAP